MKRQHPWRDQELGHTHLKGMSEAQMLERLQWLQDHRHFARAAEDIAFLNSELVLRFTGNGIRDGVT